MSNLEHTGRQGLRGLAHAARVRLLIKLCYAFIEPAKGDSIATLNRCILTAYTLAVIEDETSPTGVAYDSQSDDETVARVASLLYGQPVAAAHVRRVRKFMRSPFPSSNMEADFIRRFRIFFYGLVEGEVPERPEYTAHSIDPSDEDY